MPLVSGAITEHGAVIGVQVGVSESRRRLLVKHGMPVPSPVTVFAQIDTGAFATLFTPEIFGRLGAPPFRTISVRTPSTKRGEPCQCDQYDVSVTLASGDLTEYFPSVHAIAAEDFDSEEEIQALIGRDVLARCNFFYLGRERRFQIGF